MAMSPSSSATQPTLIAHALIFGFFTAICDNSPQDLWVQQERNTERTIPQISIQPLAFLETSTLDSTVILYLAILPSESVDTKISSIGIFHIPKPTIVRNTRLVMTLVVVRNKKRTLPTARRIAVDGIVTILVKNLSHDFS